MPIIRFLIGNILIFIFELFFSIAVYAGEIQEIKLTNELTILTLEDHSAPLASVHIFYHVGSKDEPAGLTGMTKICEKIMFEGTPLYKKGEYARIIQGGGGSLNSETDMDLTYFRATAISQLLDTILFLEADRMQNIEISYEKMVMAREAIKRERLAEVEAYIYGPLNEEIMSLSFRAHPYQHPLYGWSTDLDNITLDNLRDYFRAYFQPSNATIVITGDFDRERIINKAELLFEPIPAISLPLKRKIIEPQQRGERRGTLQSASNIPVVVTGYHIPSAINDDIAKLQLLKRILISGESSRLYRKMVIDEKSALNIGGDVITLEDPGLAFFYAILNYGVSPSIGERQLLDEIEKLKSSEVSSSELVRAKNRMTVDYYRSSKTITQKGFMIGYFYLISGDWSLFGNYISKAQAITADEIKETAQKYFTFENRNIIILQPAPINEPDTGQ
jgi:predicted Zn-dependent peptidase